MTDLKLELSEEDIKSMSQYKLKSLIRNRIEKLAISYLEYQKKQICSEMKIFYLKISQNLKYKTYSKSEIL